MVNRKRGPKETGLDNTGVVNQDFANAILGDEPQPDRTWFGRLDPSQQADLIEVRRVIHERGLPMLPKARRIIAALGLGVSACTVRQWLSQHE